MLWVMEKYYSVSNDRVPYLMISTSFLAPVHWDMMRTWSLRTPAEVTSESDVVPKAVVVAYPPSCHLLDHEVELVDEQVIPPWNLYPQRSSMNHLDSSGAESSPAPVFQTKIPATHPLQQYSPLVYASAMLEVADAAAHSS